MGIKEKVTEMATGALGWIIMPLFFLIPIGDLYWIWMAIQFGSFGMFFVGLIPPFFFIAAPVGAWSLIFGPPDWVIRMFG